MLSPHTTGSLRQVGRAKPDQVCLKLSLGRFKKTISMETFSLLACGMVLIFSKPVFLWIVKNKAVHPVFVSNHYIYIYFLFVCLFVFFKEEESGIFFILCLVKSVMVLHKSFSVFSAFS